VGREIPQHEFVAGITERQQWGLRDIFNMPHVVNGIWRCEGFATSFGKYRIPENTLHDPEIPREAQPAAHVGYGAASAEYAQFSAARHIEIGETKTHPQYRGFYYEGAGSVLRIYEPGIFKILCGILGLIPLPAPPGPDPAGFYARFLSAYPPEAQRLIAHGYGRLMAFSTTDVHHAIGAAMQLPPERSRPAVQGIGFAFGMMHSAEMPRLLNHSAIDVLPAVRAAFQTGLICALVFCDWFAPGFLEVWKAQGGLEEKMVDKAREESALNLKRGYPLPFLLENPLE
jgi:hypothetical protein